MGAAAGAVLIFQKGNLIFQRMIFGEVSIDTTLAALNIAAVCQSSVDFILSDKLIKRWDLCYIRCILPAGKVVVLQHVQYPPGIV